MVKQGKLWSLRKMEAAIQAVLKKEVGYLRASKLHNVPLTTLKQSSKKIKDGVSTY